jgi:predicted AAA+ superfamily ATPase
VHNKLIQLLRKYFILGGMPAVIDEYIASRNIWRCGEIQQIIIQTYRDDFGKYASRVKHRYLEKVFYSVPKMVGNKFKYSHVDQNVQSRELKEALEMIEKAGVVQRVFRSSGFGVPLEANASERHFKVVFCDVGLMQTLCGLEAQTAMATDLIAVNNGALAEQFVAQELNVYRDYHVPPSLHYWARESRNSSAEVDYLITHGPHIIPLEVKAVSTGRLRSMHLFFEQYNQSLGIKISQDFFNWTKPVLSIPLYGIEAISPLLALEFDTY